MPDDDTDAVFFGRIKGRALFDMKFDKGSHLGEIDNRARRLSDLPD